MTNFVFDIAGFNEDVQADLRRSEAAFRGKYKDQLNDLMGLSRSEVDAITPGISDLQTYDQLIAVVKDASAKNLRQAELKDRIEKLGELARSIAEKVPSLAALLG